MATCVEHSLIIIERPSFPCMTWLDTITTMTNSALQILSKIQPLMLPRLLKAEEEELNTLIAEEIDLLPDQEKRVVRLYYKDGMILKEIGKILNVTESRVSQIRTQAMLRIRNRLKSLGVTLY